MQTPTHPSPGVGAASPDFITILFVITWIKPRFPQIPGDGTKNQVS